MPTTLARRLLLTLVAAAIGLVVVAPAAGANEVIDPCIDVLDQQAELQLEEVPQDDLDDCLPVACTPVDVLFEQEQAFANLEPNGQPTNGQYLYPCPEVTVEKVFTDQEGNFVKLESIPDFLVEAYDGTDTTAEPIAVDTNDSEENTSGPVTGDQYTVTEAPMDGWREVQCGDEVIKEYSAPNSGTGTFNVPLQIASFDQEIQVTFQQRPMRYTHPVCNAPAPQVEVLKVFTDQDGVALDDAPDPLPDFTVDLFSGTADGDPVATDTPEATEADRTGTLAEDTYAVTETVADGYEEVTCAPATIEELEATAAGTGSDLTAPEPGTTIRHIVCNAEVPPVPTTATLTATTECGDEFPEVTWTVDVTEGDDPVGEITVTVTTIDDGEQIDSATATADAEGVFVLEGYDGVAVEVAWDWDDSTVALTTRSDCPGSSLLAAGDEQDQLPAAGPHDAWFGIAGLMLALGVALLHAAPRPRRQRA